MGIAVEQQQQQFLFLISLLLVVCVPMSFRKLSTSTSFLFFLFILFHPDLLEAGYNITIVSVLCCQLADILVIASFFLLGSSVYIHSKLSAIRRESRINPPIKRAPNWVHLPKNSHQNHLISSFLSPQR
jgi:hypothetical protein